MTRARTMMGRLSRSSRARGPAWRLAAWAVATALMVEVVGFAAWRTYDGWRRGRVVLTNDRPPLTVQVLGESGEEPVGAPFDLVTESTLALPDGDYWLRVNGVGRLGQTFRMAVNRGETIAHRLSLEPALDRGETIARRPSLDHGEPLADGGLIDVADAAGAVLLIGWPSRRIFRWIERSRRQPSAHPN